MASKCAIKGIISIDGDVDGTNHQFKINYSKIKDMSIGQHVTSPIFKSGGCKWAIKFYPKGCKRNDNDLYSSVFLMLLDHHKSVKVSFSFDISARDEIKGARSLRKRFDQTFTKSEMDWGLHRFIQRTTLEEQCVTNGFVVVVCTINIEDKTNDGALEDFSKLLKTGELTDVTFEVDGEIFQAHRLILSARSPVFKAELFGSMSETRTDCIKIGDMQCEVFKALLHFVYTYSLPNDINTDMNLQLLLAADRYAMEGLIVRCEKRLIENLSLDTVLGFLSCAERHNFYALKDACLEMVAQQKNFIELALTEEYNVMVQEFPSLLADLKERIIRS